VSVRVVEVTDKVQLKTIGSLIGLDLGGHLKTGHSWTLQNRPTERNQNKSIYTPWEGVQANSF
jgi:hypothetical protein